MRESGPVHSIEELTKKLSMASSKRIPGAQWMKHASVAIVLREYQQGIQILMIKRAVKEGDPWSGHMAFPGGRAEPGDEHLLATAIRETQEEICLDLSKQGQHIADLSMLPATLKRVFPPRLPPLVVSPFVFQLDGDPILEPNQEVAEVVWIPLSFFLETNNRSSMTYPKFGLSWELPCYRYEGRVIWGLSLRMLDELCRRIR